ncbi:MAG: glycosyltransferase family 2 protein [Pseudomonadota bacterium]
MARVSAIVVTYHTGPSLKDGLYALASDPDIDEIVIVDNGNPASMGAWITDFAVRTAKATYLKAPKNLGFGRGVNLGAVQATGDTLLIINPDCILRQGSIVQLLAAADGAPSPWIVGGRIFDVRGQAQRGPRRRELTLGRALSKLAGGPGIDLPDAPLACGPEPMDVISGAFFLIDRAGFDTLGGFDEDYFLHVEDIDLCKRAHLMGGSVIYAPSAGALHYGATSEVSALVVERHKAAGFARYFRKFAQGPLNRIAAELTIPLIYFGLLGRAWFRARRGQH